MNEETRKYYNEYILVDSKLQELTKKTRNKKNQEEYEKLRKQYYNLKKELNKKGIIIGDIRNW